MRIRVRAQKGSLAVDVFLFGRFSRVEGGVRLGGITGYPALCGPIESVSVQSLVTSYAPSC